ncbi:MAG TPA: LacI family DNA-binding transcriptional regulator [Chthoniobacteraceae bacterium]|nr:LacI family DNA-binding transcriptional regulator [Chthoniobacteraceae bacterium]
MIRSTHDLARQLGLSRWTVSRVINGHAGVHPDTVRRVHAAMEQYRFSPNPLAKGLRHGKTSIIGVGVPEIEAFHLGPKLERLRHELEARGFYLMVGVRGNAAWQEVELLDRFRELCVAGMISFASSLGAGNRAVRRLAQAGVPLVMVDPRTASPPRSSVLLDRAAGMREATGHLLDLGHRRLASVGLFQGGFYSQQRLEGIRSALESRGLDPEGSLTHYAVNETAASYYQGGYEAAEEIVRGWKKRDRPTAFLVINDQVATGVLKRLQEAAIDIPGEGSIIGYDRMDLGNFLTPKLTTIDGQPAALMEAATARLLQAIDGEAPERGPARAPIAARLVIRETTGPA